MLKSIITTALVVYVVVGTALYLLQRKFIYVPSTGEPSRAEFGATDMEEVAYRTEDGIDLYGWFKPPADRDAPVIVFFHGNAGHIGHRAAKVRPFIDAEYGVFLAEYRGYGGNGGAPSEEGLYADARAALDLLAATGFEAESVILYGESLGSAVAVQMAIERQARALVLEAPFSSLVGVARKRFPIYPTDWLVADRFDSASKIGRLEVPILIFHGEHDSVVPVELGRRLFEAAQEPKEGVFIKQADHNDLYDHGAVKVILQFLQRSLSSNLLDHPARPQTEENA
ncbi:MAG: alpha/beta hydrolase [Alphaproteobacteria bacterium]|nr:alpha/beta hydrolase [Alphaproteobacteria bacterium]